jgi:purine-binding chemotaxis protein CheW
VTEASSTSTVPALVFRLADQQYALLIEDVIEVAAMVAMARVPDAPTGLLGVANRHGDVLPLLDLRLIFGLETLPVTSATLFIVVRAGGQVAGLVVDEVLQVKYLAYDPAHLARGAGKYIQTIVSEADALIQILALAPLLAAHLTHIAPGS